MQLNEKLEDELNELLKKDMSLQLELSGIEQREQAEKKSLEEKNYALRTELYEKLETINRDISRWENELTIYDDAFKRSENEIKTYETKLKDAQALVFDDSSIICPTCGQLYQLDKQEQIKKKNEKHKEDTIRNIENAIKNAKSMFAIKKAERVETEKKIDKAKQEKSKIESELNNIVDSVSIPDTYRKQKEEISKTIQKNNSLIAKKKAGLPIMTLLKSEELNLNGELRDCEIKLSKADDNVRIDEKIAELRQQQIIFGQDRANAEKILYQLDMIQKEKNLVVTDEINKHFTLVHWKMFDYLKNGSYTETCIPMVGDKELGAALNNAMQIRAKIDICNSLQNFYDTHYPVFLDNSEALDKENQNHLVADTQLILLSVKD